MGLYGEYRIGSDGWDDGFGQMLDSGDGASDFHIMYAEWEPSELDDWDDHEHDNTPWPDAGAFYDADRQVEQEWNDQGLNFRRQVIRQEWENVWGELSATLAERFLHRHELTELILGYPHWLVTTAVRSRQMLVEALSLAQRATERTDAPGPHRRDSSAGPSAPRRPMEAPPRNRVIPADGWVDMDERAPVIGNRRIPAAADDEALADDWWSIAEDYEPDPSDERYSDDASHSSDRAYGCRTPGCSGDPDYAHSLQIPGLFCLDHYDDPLARYADDHPYRRRAENEIVAMLADWLDDPDWD